VRIAELGEFGQVVRTEGPLVVVNVGGKETAAIPLADGTVRTSLPTQPLRPGPKSRTVADLNDDELTDGAALLAFKAARTKGAAKESVLARQAEFFTELERRHGVKLASDKTGAAVEHLTQCL